MNALRLSIAAGALAFGGVLFAQTAGSAADAPSTAQAPSAAPAPQGGPAHGHGHGHGHGPREGRGPGEGVHRDHGHHGHHAHGGHRGGAFMMRLDENRDGKLGRNEILSAQQRQLAMFDRADTDRDGTLTREEMSAARQSMRDELRRHRGERARDGERRGPAAASASPLPVAERNI